jgi:hypothetical protein
MARESIETKEQFRRLVIGLWHISCAKPRESDDSMQMLRQLNASRFVRDVALPLKKGMCSHAKECFATYGTVDTYAYDALVKYARLGLLIFVPASYLFVLLCPPVIPIHSWTFVFTVIVVLHIARYIILSKDLRNSLGFIGNILKKCFFINKKLGYDLDEYKRNLLNTVFKIIYLTGKDKEHCKLIDIINVIYRLFLTRRAYREKYFLHELYHGLNERIVPTTINFLSQMVMPVWQSMMKELLEASVRALALLHHLLCSRVSKFVRGLTSREQWC